MALSEYCVTCAVAHDPVRAVGVDEDGEPACRFHAMPNDVGMVKKEKPMERKCACGCGGSLEGYRESWRYMRGHKPVGGAVAPKAKVKAKAKTNGHASEPEAINESVASLTVNEEQLNRFLNGLPMVDKAKLANAYLRGTV